MVGAMADRPTGRSWTFLSNHAHVFICVVRDPGVRVRDIALRVGITERAASAILGDLEHGGYLSRHRVGRRNSYSVDLAQPLRHPLEDGQTVSDLLGVVIASDLGRSLS